MQIWFNIGSGNDLLLDGTKPSFESNFTASTKVTILYSEFENDTFKITATSPRGHWFTRHKGNHLDHFCPVDVQKAKADFCVNMHETSSQQYAFCITGFVCGGGGGGGGWGDLKRHGDTHMMSYNDKQCLVQWAMSDCYCLVWSTINLYLMSG